MVVEGMVAPLAAEEEDTVFHLVVMVALQPVEEVVAVSQLVVVLVALALQEVRVG